MVKSLIPRDNAVNNCVSDMNNKHNQIVDECKKNGPRPILFGFWCLMINTTKLD